MHPTEDHTMKSARTTALAIHGLALATAAALGCAPPPDAEPPPPPGDGTQISTQEQGVTNSISVANEFGTVKVVSTDTAKGIDRNNPFFKSLGANGRSCESCHKVENAMGISADNIRKIFDRTQGLDPIFRTNDGSNAPTGPFARTSTVEERKASFSMLVDHGVIRVGEPVPEGADFTVAVRDPYGFASAAELSLFRRPLPSVNVFFLPLVMWDGRESEAGRGAVRDALINQADDATTGHAQRATSLDRRTREQIADFQLNLFAAQGTSKLVGTLTTSGCPTCDRSRGGPTFLSKLVSIPSPGGEEQGGFPVFGPGVNDSFAPGFKNISFTVFEPWESDNFFPDPADVVATNNNNNTDMTQLNRNRGDIGDGENIFYTKPIKITGVAGLNDVLDQPVVMGFCTTCHDTPDVGNNSLPRLFDIGIAHADGNPLFTADFPVYTITSKTDSEQRIRVTDPGMALRTGKFQDVGRFKVPVLRGVGSRAPYFHNGQARTLTDVLHFYNQRFQIGFTDEEIRKVVLFLQQV
jgi:cytochrome c peroxidase